MTVLDDRLLMEWASAGAPPVIAPGRRPVPARVARPAPARPAIAPLHYRGSGVRVSQARHTNRPVSTTVSVALAALAALITLWLGALAQASDRAAVSAPLPDRLAVVQVQAGETLQQLAGRIAPDSPAGQVVARIRELNKLESSSIDAGQTLIAPVG